MSDEPGSTPAPGTPEANDLVVRGPEGDPLPRSNAVRMIECESYERVIEGLKMAADACMHLAKAEAAHGQTWKDIGAALDKMRLEACRLAGLGLVMAQNETQAMRGEPLSWRRARERFLDGIRQATGGMRQLATCFRGDFHWSLMAQQLERRERSFRNLLAGPRRILAPTPQQAALLQRRLVVQPRLILPPGLTRH